MDQFQNCINVRVTSPDVTVTLVSNGYKQVLVRKDLADKPMITSNHYTETSKLSFGDNIMSMLVCRNNHFDQAMSFTLQVTGFSEIVTVIFNNTHKANGSNIGQSVTITGDGDFINEYFEISGNAPSAHNYLYLDFNHTNQQSMECAYKKSSLDFTGMAIEFEKIPEPNPGKLDIITNHVIENTGNAVVHKTYAASKSKSTSFSWGLSQSLSITESFSIEASTPFVKSSSTFSITLGFGSHQDWSETSTDSYDVSTRVTVPPDSVCIINGWVDWIENVKLSFDAQINVTSAKWLENKLSTQDLQQLLINAGYKGEFDIVDDQTVQISIPGTFSGTYGAGSHDTIDTQPLKPGSAPG
jgi:hypothetical protein